MKALLLGLLAVAVIYIGYVLFHIGAFKPVSFAFIDGPAYQTVYKEHVGPYYKISESISEVEKWLAMFNIDCRQSFGQFLDDPKTVEEDRLRSHVGCIVHLRKEDPSIGILYKEIPAQKYLAADFAGSPAIGPYKVYPKAMEMIEEKRLKLSGPVMEIYSLRSGGEMKTDYYFPVSDTPTADGSN